MNRTDNAGPAAHPTAAHPARRLPRLPRTGAFGVASLALLMVFVCAGTPIPLYAVFRAENGIDDSALAAATVVYLATTASSLLLVGRLSDHVGRRPVAIVAVIASMAGALVLTNVDSLPDLMLGRILQGIGCGVASSALGSFVVDNAPRRPAWLPAVVTGIVPPFGVPLGAIISGLLVDHGPAPRTFGLTVVAVILGVLALGLLACEETITRRPGALRSMRPQIVIPHGAGRTTAAVGAALVTTWSIGGFYQAFGPAMAEERLGVSGSLAVALVFASSVLLAPIGGPLAGRWRAEGALRVGLLAYVASFAVATGLLSAGLFVPFIAVSLVASVAMGVVGSSAMRLLLAPAGAHQRAGVLATSYLMSYSGAAIPGLAASGLAAMTGVLGVAIAYLILGLIMAATAIVLVRGLAARSSASEAAPE